MKYNSFLILKLQKPQEFAKKNCLRNRMKKLADADPILR